MATTPAIIPDIEAQAKAQLPQVQATPPWEDEPRLLERPTSKMGVAFSRAKDWLAEHEKHFSETTLAPFRQGLDNMADELQRAGETGHTAAGGELSPVTRALVEGAGTLLRWTPVGSDIKETLSANIIPPELGPEGKAALKAKKVIDFSSIAGHVQLGEKASPKEPPKPRLGPGKDFYSTLEHVVETKIPDKVSGEQLLSTLTNAGVSKREIEHVGIKDFATEPRHVNKLRDSIDKEEILAHVRERVPHVETVQKGGQAKASDEFKALSARHVGRVESLKASLRNRLGLSDQGANDILFNRIGGLPANISNRALALKLQESGIGLQEARDWVNDHTKEIEEFHSVRKQMDELRPTDEKQFEAPKYESYTLSGGENYREVLLKLPAKDVRAESKDPYDIRAARIEEGEDYHGPHFDEPNVVAHLRLKDRTDVNGKKTLFIEELQSDWAREMRESRSHEDVAGDTPGEAGIRAAREESRVPDMPFDKSWHELALKKALHIAATEGYDQVAWTTGAQQAERYNLRNYFDDIVYQENGQLSATPKHGITLHQKVSPENLASFVGKENAKKLLEQLENRAGYPSKIARLQLDEPIAMGGEHHLRLYDEMVPQFLNKHTKKWGGKVGETEIKVGVPDEMLSVGGQTAKSAKVQALAITPEMREGIKGGQPLLGADKLDFSSIQGHVQHTGVEGGESEMERLRRAPPREAPAKTPEEVKGETDRAETAAAEERLPKHLGGKAESKTIPGHVELAVKKVEQLEPGDMGYMRADGTHVGQPTDPKWTGGQLTHEQLASREHEDLNKILDAGGVRYRVDAGKVNKNPAGSVQIVGLSEKSVANAKSVIERMPTDNVIFESYPVKGGKPVTIEGTPKEVIAQINRHVRANQGERYDLSEVPGHVKESRDKLSGKKPLTDAPPRALINIAPLAKRAGGVGGNGPHIVEQIADQQNSKLITKYVENGSVSGTKLKNNIELYHSTDPQSAKDILEKGLRPKSFDVGRGKFKSTNLGPRSLSEGFGPSKREVLLKVTVPKGTRIFKDNPYNDPLHIRIFNELPPENIEVVKGAKHLKAQDKLSGKKPLKEK